MTLGAAEHKLTDKEKLEQVREAVEKALRKEAGTTAKASPAPVATLPPAPPATPATGPGYIVGLAETRPAHSADGFPVVYGAAITVLILAAVLLVVAHCYYLALTRPAKTTATHVVPNSPHTSTEGCSTLMTRSGLS